MASAVAGTGAGAEGALSAAQRARAERNRQRARALQEARLQQRPGERTAVPRELDSGGGFLLEPEPESAPRPVAPHAPLVHASEQPHCLLCARPFPQSYLFDTFDYSVCDECRDDEGAHALVTRTEAKTEFLLKDCDLDSRPPPLRFERRRNPHRGGADMRLYLRAQLEERAALVWGSAEALEEERGRRAARAGRARRGAADRRLRALRLQVRSSLYARAPADHAHSWAPERDLGDDMYERECRECGHKETYEKM